MSFGQTQFIGQNSSFLDKTRGTPGLSGQKVSFRTVSGQDSRFPENKYQPQVESSANDASLPFNPVSGRIPLD